MKDAEVIDQYVRLAPFLAEVFGPGCEVAVHDVTNPEHSIIAIYNNVSGRESGDPLTDLALDLVNRSAYVDADYLVNYNGRTKNGVFLSSTYYIKNEGRLIGLLCINKDVTAAQEVNNALHLLLERYNLTAAQQSKFSENLDRPLSNLLQTRVADAIAKIGTSPARMSMQEKISVVHHLNESDVLIMKGAVAEIARQLKVSEPTVYRYIRTPLE